MKNAKAISNKTVPLYSFFSEEWRRIPDFIVKALLFVDNFQERSKIQFKVRKNFAETQAKSG